MKDLIGSIESAVPKAIKGGKILNFKLACASLDFPTINKEFSQIALLLEAQQPIAFSELHLEQNMKKELVIKAYDEDTRKPVENPYSYDVEITKIVVKVRDNIPVFYFDMRTTLDIKTIRIEENLKNYVEFSLLESRVNPKLF